MATASGEDDTIIGKECHIVAQPDHPTVARATAVLLDPDEKDTWAKLIEHRHAYDNLVLMCGVHSDLIDLRQNYSVAQVVEIKKAHEQSVDGRRRAQQAKPGSAGGDPAQGDRVAWPFLLDDIGAWQRKAVVALGESEPGALQWLLTADW